MTQETRGRGVLVLGCVDGDIELDASGLGFLLVYFDILGLDPSVDFAIPAVPDAHFVNFLSLSVVDYGRAGREVDTTPIKAECVETIAIPLVFVPLADLIIYGGDEVLDVY